MWPDSQETADLVTFTEEILNGKLHFYAVFLAEEIVFYKFISEIYIWFLPSKQATCQNKFSELW